MKLTALVVLFIFSFVGTLGFARDASKDCEGMNHPAYQDEYRACLRVQIAAGASAAGVDCVDCIFKQEDSSNSLVEALSVVAQPLAYLAGTYLVASYQNKTQEAWAKAYSSGFEQCTNRFNSFLDYNTTIGANPLTSTEASAFSASCNNYGYGSYAGYGGLTSNGYGGYGNPFLMNGYSSGFMSGYGGMYGSYGYPYGMYGNGMMSGSIGISGYLGIGTTGTTLPTSSSVYQTGVTSGFSF